MISVVKSRPEHHNELLRLLDGAAGAGMTPEERRRHGFIQSGMSATKLRELEAQRAIHVAVDAIFTVVGMAVASIHSVDEPGARGGIARAMRDAYPDKTVINYGPAVVAPDHQGKGVSRALLRSVAKDHQEVDFVVAFVADENERSAAIHSHLLPKRGPRFSVGERRFSAFLAQPADLF